MKFDTLKTIFAGVFLALVSSFLLYFLTHFEDFFLTSLINKYENNSYDSRMTLKSKKENLHDDVVIVDIDQLSINEMGNFKDWPHTIHGKLVDVISSAQPKAIIFDIIFDKEDTSAFHLISTLMQRNKIKANPIASMANTFLSLHDPQSFIHSIENSGCVFLALIFERDKTEMQPNLFAEEPDTFDYQKRLLLIPKEQASQLYSMAYFGNSYLELLNAAQGTGSVNIPTDDDGVIRKAPTAISFSREYHVYPSITMAVIKNILDIPANGFEYNSNNYLYLRNQSEKIVREIPIDKDGRIKINYYGGFNSFNYLPYFYCLDPELLPTEYFKDKIVLVGSSQTGLVDLRNTPVGTMPGVEIHANILQNLLNNEFLRSPSLASQLLTIIILNLFFAALISLIKKPLYSVFLLVILTIGWVAFSYSQFIYYLMIWEIIRPISTLCLTFLSIQLYHYMVIDRTKRFLSLTFAKYVSPDLIEQMIRKKEMPRLGGEEGQITAFFSDIEGFSSISEKLSPTQLIELLNDYLTTLTDELLRNKGTLDKYQGDAIIAFFGAPLPITNQEYYACLTAVRMQTLVKQLQEKWKKEKNDWPSLVHQIRCRIGLNTGKIVTGNIGSNLRMDYTMIGDAVNLAARLESACKQYGVYTMAAESTYLAVKDRFVWRELDVVRVVGKQQAVRVFELISEKDNMPVGYDQLLPMWQKGIELYRNREWEQAIEVFRKTAHWENNFQGRKTNPSLIYLDRCKNLLVQAPGQQWEYVFDLKSK